MRSIKFLWRVLALANAMEDRERWERREFADRTVFVVLPPSLPPKKLERLRWLDSIIFREFRVHLFANFLPDGERPADVPAL